MSKIATLTWASFGRTIGWPLDVTMVDSTCVTVTSFNSCACSAETNDRQKTAAKIARDRPFLPLRSEQVVNPTSRHPSLPPV
jgi:hypothetical protein